MHQLDPKQLRTAGHAARISAALGLLSLLLLFFRPMLSQSYGSNTPDTLLMIVTFGGVGLLMLVYKTFQAYLNQRFKFHEADTHINLLIWLNIIAALLVFLDTMFLEPPDPDGGGWPPGLLAMIICAVAIGLVVMILASRVARLPDELFGLMKPYYICMKVAGICMAAVFTSPVGVIFGAAADLVLSKVFFRAAAEMDES